MRNLLIFFFLFLLLTGCKKFSEEPKKQCFIPYVDFVAQHVNTATLEVSFTAVTTYNGTITSHKWEFGDGTTFNGPNPPPHKYPPPSSSSGSSKYRVKYTVANECGEAYWTQDVTISPCLPDPKFSFKYLNDSTVEFTNQTKSGTTTNYVWNFGDGTTGTSAENSFTHVYKQDKSFTVSLKATNSCGENNYTETISVCRQPSASQSITVNGCGAVSIDASASKAAAKYQWDFGNGTVLPATPSSSPTISYTYPNGGTYTIKLTVFNATGCASASVSNTVSVSASTLGTNSNWSYTSNDLDFSFTRAAITNASAYKWNFGDGNVSTLQNPSHSYTNPGSYSITLTASSSCGASYEFSVPINVPYYKALRNIPTSGFRQVLVFSPSLIYFLGANGRLYKTDTAGTWSSPIDLPDKLDFNDDTKLYKDLNNNLWIYGKKDVARFNPSNSSWTSFFSAARFPKNATISSMAIDNNNELWAIGDGILRKGDDEIRSSVSFSSLAYAPDTRRIWLTSSKSSSLFYVNTNSREINTINGAGISNGGDEIKIGPTGEIFIASGTGIVRTNSFGNVNGNYNRDNTGGLINGRPAAFDFGTGGNLWVLISGQLYKLPLSNSGGTKKYSFNSDLSNLSSIGVLNLSSSDTDILLAKNSGNAAIKIR